MSLLSIDADAHLQKLACHNYSSKALYSVELVRLALLRGADRVEVTVKSTRVVILDNGRGIDERQLELLCRSLDPRQSAPAREQAILDLKSPLGIGLLALFSPAPARIQVENVRQKQGKTMLIERGNSRELPWCGITTGTRLTLFRNSVNINLVNQEKRVLEHYCRAAVGDVFLNGKPIQKKPLLTQSLVSVKLKSTGNAPWRTAALGIPTQGDMCQVWLLDQGIPWFHKILPAWHGFIFEAALESDREFSESLLNQFSATLPRLYRWLADRYPTYPPSLQERVEELLFKHNRLTGDVSLVNRFSPFKVCGSAASLSLSQVTSKASSGNLFAIPVGKNPRSHPPRPGTTFILTRSQLDFLINQHRLPLTVLSPHKGKSSLLGRLYSPAKKWRDFFSRFRFRAPAILEENSLTQAERAFINGLFIYLSSTRGHYPLPGQGIEPKMVSARGFYPSLFTPPLLLIRREHPLIKKAVRAYQADTRNIEMIAPLLF